MQVIRWKINNFTTKNTTTENEITKFVCGRENNQRISNVKIIKLLNNQKIIKFEFPLFRYRF